MTSIKNDKKENRVGKKWTQLWPYISRVQRKKGSKLYLIGG